MDVQTRKLNVIETLIRLPGDDMIQEIENLIIESKTINDKKFHPLTEDDLIKRAEKSNSDYISGEIIDIAPFEEEFKNW